LEKNTPWRGQLRAAMIWKNSH